MYVFFCFVYIKWLTSAEKLWKNDIEVIVFNGIKWLNEKNTEDQLKHSNLPAVTLQYSSELRKKDKNYKIVASISRVEDF